MTCESSSSYSQTETSGTQSMKSNQYNKCCQVAWSNSVLVGKEICKLEVAMYTNNALQNGTIQGGVWDSTGNLKWNGGTINASSLTSSSAWYTFTNPSGSSYEIAAGDRIGVYSDATTEGGRIIVNTDDSNPTFDGSASHFSVWNTNYSGGGNWSNFQGSYDLDLAFKFYQPAESTQEKVTVYFFEDNTTEADAHWRTPSSSGGGGSSSSTAWKWWLGMRYGTRKRYGTNHIRKMRV